MVVYKFYTNVMSLIEEFAFYNYDECKEPS